MNTFLNYLSTALNSLLSLDPDSASHLKKLAGKVATIELLPWHFVFQCHFHNNRIELIANENSPADVRISGTPLAMLGMMLNKNQRHRFFADDITMQGDAALGQEIVNLFDKLQIDWQEPLSKCIGDVPTYYADRIVQGLKSWLQHTHSTMTANVSEYVHEEAEWLPSKEALQDLFLDIDELRMDADRLEVRVKSLVEVIIQ